MALKKGDFIFTKKAKRSSNAIVEFGSKGYFFSLLLGEVPPEAPDPPESHLLRMMGDVGFISFDDIILLAGPEVALSIVQRFEKKYYGKVMTTQVGKPLSQLKLPDGIAPVIPLVPPRPIIGIDGKPLGVKE